MGCPSEFVHASVGGLNQYAECLGVVVNRSLFGIPVDKLVAESHHGLRIVSVRVLDCLEISFRCFHVHRVLYPEHVELVVALVQGLIVCLF